MCFEPKVKFLAELTNKFGQKRLNISKQGSFDKQISCIIFSICIFNGLLCYIAHRMHDIAFVEKEC